MKLIDMTCPHCSAKLKVDADMKIASCEFCGTNGMASLQLYGWD